MKTIFAVIAIILILNALIFDTANQTQAIIKSIETCLYTIIPALFGFMAISSFLLKSGLYRIIFKPFFIIFRYVFKLNEEQFGIFLLSLFGGYPIGAKLIAENPENKKILPFCYCPSPGFVIAVVGIGFFSNPKIGFAVYLSNVIACMIIALFICRDKSHVYPIKKEPPQITQKVFNSSILSASSALFPACATVTAFGVIGGVLEFYGVRNLYIHAVLQVTNISQLSPSLSLLPFIAALFSFGSVYIIMQIPALTGGKFSLKQFFLWRIPAAIISAIICRLFIILGFISHENAIPALAWDGNEYIPLDSGSPIASAALLIMAVILVKSAQEKEA
jgi:hypothetical protein